MRCGEKLVVGETSMPYVFSNYDACLLLCQGVLILHPGCFPGSLKSVVSYSRLPLGMA